jgi:hypothetical protein
MKTLHFIGFQRARFAAAHCIHSLVFMHTRALFASAVPVDP